MKQVRNQYSFTQSLILVVLHWQCPWDGTPFLIVIEVEFIWNKLNLKLSNSSGITPIGQGWTNARGLRGLGGPEPDPRIFLYILIFQVYIGVSHLFYSTADLLWTSTSHFIIVLYLMVILVSTLIIINCSVNSKWGMGLLCNLSKGLQSICYATVQFTE